MNLTRVERVLAQVKSSLNARLEMARQLDHPPTAAAGVKRGLARVKTKLTRVKRVSAQVKGALTARLDLARKPHHPPTAATGVTPILARTKMNFDPG